MIRHCALILLLPLALQCMVEEIRPRVQPQMFPIPTVSNARLHGFPSISPDSSEMIWPVIPPRIMMSRSIDGKWSPPFEAPFSQGNIQASVYSPDGSRIYFQANLPQGMGGLDIWYVQRESNGWSKPINLGSPVNSVAMESQPSVTRSGQLYFTGQLQGSGWNRGIYRAEFKDGRYLEPVLLDGAINSKAIDMYPFIHPDEKYLLFSSSRPGIEEKDMALYVCHRTPDGRWLPPVNISKHLGLKGVVRFGSLSSDGRYLRYMLENRIYEIDSRMIPQADEGNTPEDRYATRIQKLTRLSPRALIITGAPTDCNQLVYQSEKGLVLVDSGHSPEYGELLKKTIEREFPGQTVRYLINTHHHWDHVQGNQVFTDATIIAQHKVYQAMIRQAEDRADSEKPAAVETPGILPPPPRPTLSVSSKGYRLTLPSRLFHRKLTVNLGDETMEITAVPECHSTGDLIVWFKEARIAATGDLLFKKTLPILNRPQGQVGHKYLEALAYLLSEHRSIKHIVPGHDALLSCDDLRTCTHYITQLLEDIGKAVSLRLNIETTQNDLSLSTWRPDLLKKDMSSQSNGSLHESNVRAIYRWYLEKACTPAVILEEKK